MSFRDRITWDTEEIEDALANARLHKYSPDQPRDKDGKWTDGGTISFDRDRMGTRSPTPAPGEGLDVGQSMDEDLAYERNYSPWAYQHQEPRGETTGAQFASPSISDKGFAQATEAVSGERQAAFKKAGAEIDGELGLNRATHVDVIGAWKDGAENSIMSELDSPPNPQALRTSAAMKGALGNQKSVLVFNTQQGGPDHLFEAWVAQDPAAAHETLLKAGIPFHTLQAYKDGTNVYAVDTDGSLAPKIGEWARSNDTLALRLDGHAEFLGDTEGTGTDAEQRARAQEAYAQVIRGDNSGYSGRSAGTIWQGVRDRWASHLQALKRIFNASLLKRAQWTGGIEIRKFSG